MRETATNFHWTKEKKLTRGRAAKKETWKPKIKSLTVIPNSLLYEYLLSSI